MGISTSRSLLNNLECNYDCLINCTLAVLHDCLTAIVDKWTVELTMLNSTDKKNFYAVGQ